MGILSQRLTDITREEEEEGIQDNITTLMALPARMDLPKVSAGLIILSVSLLLKRIKLSVERLISLRKSFGKSLNK